MSTPDPIALLEHDHEALSEQVVALRASLASLEASASPEPDSAAFLQALAMLTETLIEHFAREEEGLFPFVSRELPDLVPMVPALIEAHDRISGIASRILALEHLAESKATHASAVAMFRRFDEVYSEHLRSELDFLQLVATRLDASHRDELAAAMAGL